MLATVAAGIGGHLRDSSRALAQAFSNPDLRRIQLAGVGSVIGNWSYTVALAVYAYRHGGAAAVAVLTVVRLLPATLLAPFTAVVADRFARRRVMLATDALRAALMLLMAGAVALEAPVAVVFGLAALSPLIASAFRPAQAALLPSLARSPQELTAANVAASAIDSVGAFVGPALGGLLLAVSDVGWVLAFNALTFVWSGYLVARLGREREEPPPRPRAAEGLLTMLTAGVRAIASDRRVTLLVGLYGAQTLVAGALPVLLVSAALDLLEIGEAGVGTLNAALGVGGLVGVAVTLALVARARLAVDFTVGLALWGLGIGLVGVWPAAGAAVAFLALVGIGNTLVDVSALTLLQRAAPDEVLARVFGALGSLMLGTSMLGALLAPLAIGLLGLRGALIAIGGFLPVVALLSAGSLRALDRAAEAPQEQLALLRTHPIFAPLAAPALEEIAASLVPLRLAAGDVVIRRGDPGDRFYLVAEGELDVDVGKRLGRGDGFGEIALLRDVPRTATVVARTDARVFALERDDFLAVVTGHAESAEAADTVVASRLGAPARAELGM
jgi:MFS family permease